MTTTTAQREMVFTRLINADRERVFEAWTNPEQVGQWWGPVGFTTTTREFEAKPGGIWRFIMHGPSGIDYPNKVEFIEVKKPELLVYKHCGDDVSEPVNFIVTVTFEDIDGKTNLNMRMVFESAEEKNRIIEKYGAKEGAKQNLDKLEEFLNKI